MIIDALLQVLIGLGREMVSVLHLPIITELPWGIDSVLVNGLGGYRAMAVFFPPLTVVMTAFIIYLGFRIVVMVIKAIPVIGKTVN